MADGDFLAPIADQVFESHQEIGQTGRTVGDFWYWSSNLYENVQRGIFAEFIVAVALDATAKQKVGWAGYDLDYAGKKIEVKSSAYLQTWKQKTPSKPAFGIGPREQWDQEQSKNSDPRYVADVFIFCLFKEERPEVANIRNLEQWGFYVVATDILKQRFEGAKILTKVQLDLLTSPVSFQQLRERVDAALEDPNSFIEPPPRLEVKDYSDSTTTYTYAVAKRASREHPVIVRASDWAEAFALAQADATIASFGKDISSIRLSAPALKQLLADGAVDLR